MRLLRIILSIFTGGSTEPKRTRTLREKPIPAKAIVPVTTKPSPPKPNVIELEELEPSESGSSASNQHSPSLKPVTAPPEIPSQACSSKKTKVWFQVGLDFGTSTTKCITLAAIGEDAREEQIVFPINGQLLFPSMAWLQGRKLVLAKEPFGENQALRAPKIHMRAQLLGQPEPDGSYKEAGINAQVLCWAILSYCVQDVCNQIREKFPADKFDYSWRDDVGWSMGAPLDSMVKFEARRPYVEILWHAINNPTPWQGEIVALDELIDYFKRNCVPESVPVVEEGGFLSAGRCAVHPEALVAVNTFLNGGGNLEDGLYYVADIGAGTTDFAFFRYTGSHERAITFYGSASVLAGGDDLVRGLVIEQGLDFQAAQESLHRGGFSHGGVLNPFLHRLVISLRDGRRHAFREAYPKEHAMRAWKRDLHGASVTGGGSLVDPLREACLAPLRTGNGDEAIEIEPIPQRQFLPSQATLLHRTAYGLSIPPQRFFDHWRLDEVDNYYPNAGERYTPMGGGDFYAK